MALKHRYTLHFKPNDEIINRVKIERHKKTCKQPHYTLVVKNRKRYSSIRNMIRVLIFSWNTYTQIDMPTKVCAYVKVRLYYVSNGQTFGHTCMSTLYVQTWKSMLMYIPNWRTYISAHSLYCLYVQNVDIARIV